MKKIVLLSFFLLMMATAVRAQSTISLTFTAEEQNHHWIPLSSVIVEDLTRSWQDELFFPDTLYHMGNVGIESYDPKVTLKLFQNAPNPFQGTTEFMLQLNEEQPVKLEIFDINGKLLANYNGTMPKGTHHFRVTLSTPKTYLLNATSPKGTTNVKMVNTGYGGNNQIDYLGFGKVELKLDEKGASPFQFNLDDSMKYVGYAVYNGTLYESAPITQRQTGDESLVFTFDIPLYCPSTVTDFDGNIYTTLILGEQCWMRENMRTTHFSDGTPIELGTSCSLTEPRRHYPNNDSSSVSSYGYLYNWRAATNRDSITNVSYDVQGICPIGWHLPSRAEWEQLVNYVESCDEFVCDFYDYSYGYLYGGGKAMASTTGWQICSGYLCNSCDVGYDPDLNNETGFSILPAGFFHGRAYEMGEGAYFWTATLRYVTFLDGHSSYTDPYHYHLSYNDYSVAELAIHSHWLGLSVRCLQD